VEAPAGPPPDFFGRARLRGYRNPMGTYQLVDVTNCNMCGAPASDAKVLGRRLNRRQGLRPTARVGMATTIMRCKTCHLVFANPMPLPEDIGQHYDLDPEVYWDQDHLDKPDLGDLAERFHALWRGEGTPRALDIGAGLGQTMRALERSGFDVYGIEPSATFRKRAIELGIDETRLQHTGIEGADFPAQQFDYVSFGAVLEHIADPAAALERAISWTKPDGLVWVHVPSSRWLVARALNAIYRAQGLDYVTNISPMHSPFHLYEFGLESFERHGQKAGYEVADTRMLVCSTYAPPPLDRVARAVMDRTDTGMIIEVWLRARG
jgi:SAM-dependent methyltransferase